MNTLNLKWLEKSPFFSETNKDKEQTFAPAHYRNAEFGANGTGINNYKESAENPPEVLLWKTDDRAVNMKGETIIRPNGNKLSCTTRPLNKAELKPIYKAMKRFEKTFEVEDSGIFRVSGGYALAVLLNFRIRDELFHLQWNRDHFEAVLIRPYRGIFTIHGSAYVTQKELIDARTIEEDLALAIQEFYLVHCHGKKTTALTTDSGIIYRCFRRDDDGTDNGRTFKVVDGELKKLTNAKLIMPDEYWNVRLPPRDTNGANKLLQKEKAVAKELRKKLISLPEEEEPESELPPTEPDQPAADITEEPTEL